MPRHPIMPCPCPKNLLTDLRGRAHHGLCSGHEQTRRASSPTRSAAWLPGSAAPADVAVTRIVRQRPAPLSLEERFIWGGAAIQVGRRHALHERKEIKDMLAYLAAVVVTEDDDMLRNDRAQAWRRGDRRASTAPCAVQPDELHLSLDARFASEVGHCGNWVRRRRSTAFRCFDGRPQEDLAAPRGRAVHCCSLWDAARAARVGGVPQDEKRIENMGAPRSRGSLSSTSVHFLEKVALVADEGRQRGCQIGGSSRC